MISKSSPILSRTLTTREPASRRDDGPSLSPHDNASGSHGSIQRRRCVHHFFEEQVDSTPTAAAVICKSESLTYAELDQRADSLADHLRELGVGPDVPVGICLERSIEMIIGVLAILKAGGAYVPLDPAYPKERLKLMISNSRTPVLLTQTALKNSHEFEISDLIILCVDSDLQLSNHRRPITNHPSPKNLAYIIHTSGSTGTPKGVAMPHQPLINLIEWQRDNSRLGAGARTLQFASLSFDVSFQEMFSTWSAGGTLMLIDEQLRRDPVALLRFIAEENIERLFLPFIALQQLAEAFGEHTPVPMGLREVITAGEQLQITPKIVRLFETLPECTLHNHYGPSESHVVTAFTLEGEPSRWPALPPIGREIPSAQIHLLDETLAPVAEGEAGELFIGGDCLARGYLHRPDLTAEKFLPDPFSDEPGARLYKTGDLGRRLPDGNIEFLGRIDHQVKIRGFRIELGEIETTLQQHPDIRDAIVVAREDQPGNKRLAAYFVCRLQETRGEELREFLSKKLPDYMVPSHFVRLDSLPLTPSGKVDRKNLPAPTMERNGHALDAPRTPVEEKLAAIWSEVLGFEDIGIHDNFFHLGGHSLLAVQVVSRIRQKFQIEVPVAELSNSPTIAQLADGIEKERWEKETTKIPRALRHGQLPLSHSQQRLWFLHQLDPDGFAYNVPAAVLLDGELNLSALEKGLNELVQRHEILRTIFLKLNGEPAQAILPELALKLPLTDLSGTPDRDAAAQQLIHSEAQRPFDLTRLPLLRCSLCKLGGNKHILIVVMHHIISDGWSLGIFFEELANLYSAEIKSSAQTLAPLKIQYGDFAVWDQSDARDNAFKKHEVFWKTQLAGAPSSLELPTDHAPSETLDSRGDHCSISLPSELAAAVRELHREDGITPFTTLLSALTILLNRWTNQSDIVVGSVVAGRNRSELEPLIGSFMNFLPIRLQLDSYGTGSDFLNQVKAAVLDAQAHQDLPFEKILKAADGRRNSQSPLYNAGFLLQNFPEIAFAAKKVSGKFIPVETDSALLDLRFVADEIGGGYTFTCEYRTQLFERGTIEELLNSYCDVLKTLLQKPERTISEFTISSALAGQSEKHRAPSETIAVTATFTAEPLGEPLEFWMRELELPAKIEFAAYNQIFQQLLDPSSLLAENSRGLNVVLVRMEDWGRTHNGSQLSATDFETKIERTLTDFLSAFRSAAGRSATPYLLCICPPSKRFETHRAFLERSHSKVTANLATLPNVTLVLPEQLAVQYPLSDFDDPRGDELGHVPYTPAFFSALATVIARRFNSLKRPAPKVLVLDCDHTIWSGVCGEDGPDGIELNPPRRALQEFARAQLDAGRLLCLCSKNNPEDVHAVFERRTEMPLKLEHFAATRINWLPKSQNMKALAEELNLGVESFVLVDDNPVECAEVEANCPGALALQLPESPELIPQFLKHCWLFDHHGVTAEDKHRTDFYRQERERTRARTDSMSLRDFLTSLDLQIKIVELSPDDLPRVAQLTQRTNQFNSTTRRRTEAEIQELLKDHNALTISVSDRFGDYGLVGFVVWQPENDALNVESFLLSCRALGRGVEHKALALLGELARGANLRQVDVHFVPSAKNKPALDFLENVGGQFKQPLNGGYIFRIPTEIAAATQFNPSETSAESQQKTSKKENPVQSMARPNFNRWRWIALEANDAEKIHSLIESRAGVRKNSRVGITAPSTDLERELCRIWQELLRVERVGMRDNFFELGGHSLLAVRLFAQIEKRLNVKLPIITIFQSPTIEQLARVMEKSAAPDSGLLPIQPNGDRLPLFLVHGAGGDVLWGYANLAKHTDATRPIYGIQAAGADDFPTLEDMAMHYVEKVRAFQPAGPYHLGGYCFGGNVAQEMARQLEAQGEKVAVLALLDCAPSNCGYEKIQWWKPSMPFQFTRNFFFWLDDFLHLKREQRRSLVLRKLRTIPEKIWHRVFGRRSREDFDLEEFIDVTHVSKREIRLWQNHLGLLVRHTSKPYGGLITLFRTRGHPLFCSFENDFGWNTLAREVVIRKVPGSHEGIFMEPHVQTLARELEKTFPQENQKDRQPTIKSGQL